MHKTHEMITQTQKDDSYCFDDVSSKHFNSSTRYIAHSGLSAVALDVETANSIEYVRIHVHSVRSHSVAVVTQVHNARRTTSSLSTSTFQRPHLIAAVDMQISETATNRAVAFELFSTEKLMR